jgi:nicotinamide-nucleotide amidase
MTTDLRRLSRKIAELLETKQQQLVLAESCTGGLVAAMLAGVPGISNHLCGSAVTYQNATKNVWLDIPNRTLLDPGPVSPETARLMAEQVLAKTPHANLAESVTGHFGPKAPAKLDGLVFVAVSVVHAARVQQDRTRAASTTFRTKVHRCRLSSVSRTARQREATALVLRYVQQALEGIRE